MLGHGEIADDSLVRESAAKEHYSFTGAGLIAVDGFT